MDTVSNVIILADFRLNKARLLRERNALVHRSYRSIEQATCVVHRMPVPEPTVPVQTADVQD